MKSLEIIKKIVPQISSSKQKLNISYTDLIYTETANISVMFVVVLCLLLSCITS